MGLCVKVSYRSKAQGVLNEWNDAEIVPAQSSIMRSKRRAKTIVNRKIVHEDPDSARPKLSCMSRMSVAYDLTFVLFNKGVHLLRGPSEPRLAAIDSAFEIFEHIHLFPDFPTHQPSLSFECRNCVADGVEHLVLTLHVVLLLLGNKPLRKVVVVLRIISVLLLICIDTLLNDGRRGIVLISRTGGLVGRQTTAYRVLRRRPTRAPFYWKSIPYFLLYSTGLIRRCSPIDCS